MVLSEIEQLISSVDARYVLFSYSNKGKVEIKDLEKIFSQHKILAVEKISHRENVQKQILEIGRLIAEPFPVGGQQFLDILAVRNLFNGQNFVLRKNLQIGRASCRDRV